MFSPHTGKGMDLLTEKEMHKLSRQDLLQMLLSQVREVSRLKESVSQLEAHAAEQEETFTRLKQKLDDKDAQLDKLMGLLAEKDESIRTLGREIETVKAGLDRENEERLEGFRMADRAMRERLSEKDAFIDELRARLREQEKQIADLRTERDDLRSIAQGDWLSPGEDGSAIPGPEKSPDDGPKSSIGMANDGGSTDWNEFSKSTAWGSLSQLERRRNSIFRGKEKK